MTLSDLESRDARGHFFKRISLPFYVDNYQIRQHNTRGAYFYGSATPLPQGVGAPGASAPQFWSSLLFIHTTFDAEI